MATHGLTWSPLDEGPLAFLDSIPRLPETGLCTQIGPPDGWFPEDGDTVRHAKAVCYECPVMFRCMQAALFNEEEFGVWGGLSERDRRRWLGRIPDVASKPAPLDRTLVQSSDSMPDSWPEERLERKRLCDAQRWQWLAEGVPVKEIAARHKVTTDAIYKWRRDNRVGRPVRKT